MGELSVVILAEQPSRWAGRSIRALEGAGAVDPLANGAALLIEAGRSLSLDCSTLAEEARVTQYLYVAERRG